MKVIGRFSIASAINVILAVSQFTTVIALVLTIGSLVLLPFVPTPNMTVTVPVSFSLDTPKAVIVGRSGLNFDILDEKDQARKDRRGRISSVDGSLRIPEANKSVIAANVAVLIVVLAFIVFVLRELRAVLKTLIRGTPFVATNAARIRRVACAVIAGELAGSAIVFGENYYAKTHFMIEGLQFDAWPHISPMTIGYGLIILVIAEVFRAGTRLDEDQSLTI